MKHNYGECSVCHSAMIMKDGDELPHAIHDVSCPFVGHGDDYDLDSHIEEVEAEVECTCQAFASSECHPECCPACIDIGYNAYSKYNSEEEDPLTDV